MTAWEGNLSGISSCSRGNISIVFQTEGEKRQVDNVRLRNLVRDRNVGAMLGWKLPELLGNSNSIAKRSKPEHLCCRRRSTAVKHEGHDSFLSSERAISGSKTWIIRAAQISAPDRIPARREKSSNAGRMRAGPVRAILRPMRQLERLRGGYLNPRKTSFRRSCAGRH